LRAKRVDGGEFVDYVRSKPELLNGDPTAFFSLGLSGEDLAAIFAAREAGIRAAAAAAAAAAKGKRVKNSCPVTAGEFVRTAQPLVMLLPSGDEFTADPRVFKIGDGQDPKGKDNGTLPLGTSFGFQNVAEVTIMVNGKACLANVNMVCTLAGSGDADRFADDGSAEAKQDEAALVKHCQPYMERLANAREAEKEREAKRAAKLAAAAAAPAAAAS
jgi:hypothetical protein